SRKRRGAAAVWSAASMAVMLGFAALAIDTGRLYVSRSELQVAADAAVMGACTELGSIRRGAYSNVCRAAERYAALNAVNDTALGAESISTSLGHAAINSHTGKYEFTPRAGPYNAVRVDIELAGDKAVPMLFAPIFGRSELNRRPVAARATAMLIPRDIALVADTSASHNDDSELKRYRETGVNLEDVWRALPMPKGNSGLGNGEDPDRVANAGENDGGGSRDPEGNPSVPHDGPHYGYTSHFGWGQSDLGWNAATQAWNPTYDPKTDPGLVYLRKNQNWRNPDLNALLARDLYSPAEIRAIMSAQHDEDVSDGAAWPYRVAVAMGWASWSSGMTDKSGVPEGHWAECGREPGNGDTRVDADELTYVAFPGYPPEEQSQPWRRDRWNNYIRSYMDQDNGMTEANPDFKYRFGLKTLMNYLLEKRPLFDQSPDLALVPSQPMQAVKDAVRALTEVVGELDGDDAMSLEYYDRWGHHRENLTYNYDVIAESLDDLQAGQDGYYTNMGEGIQQAIAELTGPRARPHAVKIMVLLADGRANVNESGGYTDYTGGREWALDSADQAATQGIRIYCVSVGVGADRDLMQSIANRGGGAEFYAAGSIEDYSTRLREIFQTLGRARPVVLIE
ncbi:MAG: VWA domain-containing protein, partial [Phycisphaerales bacterium]